MCRYSNQLINLLNIRDVRNYIKYLLPSMYVVCDRCFFLNTDNKLQVCIVEIKRKKEGRRLNYVWVVGGGSNS